MSPKQQLRKLPELLLRSLPEDDLYLCALIVFAGDTHLPELARVFDSSRVARLVRIFGGQTIDVPTESYILKALNAVRVFQFLRRHRRKSDILLAEHDGSSLEAARRRIEEAKTFFAASGWDFARSCLPIQRRRRK